MGVLQALAREAGASLAFVERNFRLVRRYLGWELVFLFYNVINALTIGLIGWDAPAPERAERVVYLTIGALLWGFLSVLFQEIGDAVSWERWEGTIEYTFMAPIHRFTHLFGMCLYAILYGILRTAIVLLAVLLFFHVGLHHANITGALVVMAVSSLSFIGLGLMAAVLPLLSTERGSQATHIVQGVILLVSGVYYPVRVLPGWLQVFSALSPATYTLAAARRAVLGGASVASLSGDLARLAAIGLVLIPLGLGIFLLGERYAMRTGRLKRSG